MRDGAERSVLEGIARGEPVGGPLTVHIDVTNACNAACITCWDHSPLLDAARSQEWKRRRLPYEVFSRLVSDLEALGSVESVILSGMGEPLLHPRIYEMIADIKARGYHLTILTNLVAADIDRLAESGVDQLLVGVHGATPGSYMAFHPGWTEEHFFTMCRCLRRLRSAGVKTRHVQVISGPNYRDVVEMVRFGHLFGADRVSFKLASLAEGTERASVSAEERDWLIDEGVPRARSLAGELGVATNLELFERQLAASAFDLRATAPIEEIGCFMGYVYTRITVDLDVLYCCNTSVRVGSLGGSSFRDLWFGPAWQALRDRLRAGRYLPGCERCGKLEQNIKWSERYRRHAGEARWLEAAGRAGTKAPSPLRVIS